MARVSAVKSGRKAPVERRVARDSELVAGEQTLLSPHQSSPSTARAIALHTRAATGAITSWSVPAGWDPSALPENCEGFDRSAREVVCAIGALGAGADGDAPSLGRSVDTCVRPHGRSGVARAAVADAARAGPNPLARCCFCGRAAVWHSYKSIAQWRRRRSRPASTGPPHWALARRRQQRLLALLADSMRSPTAACTSGSGVGSASQIVRRARAHDRAGDGQERVAQ